MPEKTENAVWAWHCRAQPGEAPDVLKPTRGKIAYKHVLGEDVFIPDDPECPKYVLHDVDICESMDGAVAAYNAAVRECARTFLSLASATQDLLDRREGDGWSDDGELVDFPVFAVDLSSNADDVIACTDRSLSLRDESALVLPWDSFLESVDEGDFTHHDGSADLMVDGQVSRNVLVDMYRGMVYVADKYLIPFEQVAGLFAGHEVKTVWFNK